MKNTNNFIVLIFNMFTHYFVISSWMCIRELKNKSGTGMRISEQNIRNHTEKSKWKFYRIETFTKRRSTVKRLKKYCNISSIQRIFFLMERSHYCSKVENRPTRMSAATPFTRVLKAMGGKRGRDRQTMGCGRNIALLQ